VSTFHTLGGCRWPPKHRLATATNITNARKEHRPKHAQKPQSLDETPLAHSTVQGEEIYTMGGWSCRGTGQMIIRNPNLKGGHAMITMPQQHSHSRSRGSRWVAMSLMLAAFAAPAGAQAARTTDHATPSSVSGHLHKRTVSYHKRHHSTRRDGIGSYGNPYTGGGCTYWAWQNRQDLPGHLGNARYWAANAAQAGFPVDGTPEVGAIAVYQPGIYGAFGAGHVAVVEQVRGNQIYISEASYRPYLPDDGDNEIDRRWTGIVGVQFIHHRGYGQPAPASPPSTAPVPAPVPPADPTPGHEVPPSPPTSPPTGSQPGPPPPPQYYVHHVTGTCRDGACGLKLRAGPGYSSFAAVGSLPEGGEADIICQAMGETVSNGYASSAVWDRLTNGAWVSDFYIDTPNIGTWSPPIPQC
jgi:surface antigen